MKVADLLQRRSHPVLRAADVFVTHESQEDVASLRVAVLVDGHVSALPVAVAGSTIWIRYIVGKASHST